jgi:hypothetical protein
MFESVSIDQAIRKGLLVVNAPVMLLLFGPVTAAHYLVGKIPIVIAAAVIGFVLAWLWWSVSVPKWRLWAYERVADIPQLKQRAVEAGLTWRDGTLFSRTEIKSTDMIARERALDP